MGSLRPEVQPPTVLNTIFDRKLTPFVYFALHDKRYFFYIT